MPFLADPQSAVFYPFNLLLTFFIINGSFPIIILELQLILHIFLAGLFTYLFTRTLGLNRFPAFISGITYMFTGFMAAHMEHLVVINAIIWLPLILLFLEKGLREKKLRYSIPAGWAFGFSIMAGHYQMALYIGLAVLFYVAFRLFWAFQDREQIKVKIRKGLFLPLIILIGLGISAIQLIPALELIGRSYRSAIGYQFATTFSMPLYQLITLLIPNFFGGDPGRYWGFLGPGNFWEFCGYVGILPLFLAGFGVFYRRSRTTVLFFSLALFSFLLLLGGETFLHTIMYILVPGFGRNRAPARLFFLFAFSISILAGYGAGFLTSKLEDKEKESLKNFFRWIVTGSILALAGGLVFYFGLAESVDTSRNEIFVNIVRDYNFFLILFFLSLGLIFLRLREQTKMFMIQILITSIILFDLFSFGPKTFIDKHWGKIFLTKHPIVDFLKRDKEKFRINNIGAFVSSIFHIENSRGPLIPVILKKVESTFYPPSLMNIKYAVSGEDLLKKDLRDVDGLRVNVGQHFLADGRKVSIPEVKTAAVIVVSNLIDSVEVPEGTVVGYIKVEGVEGKELTLSVIAGKDTAQYNYQELDITRKIKHDKPAIAYEYEEDGNQAFTYTTKKYFSSPKIVKSLTFLPGSNGLKLRIFGVTLVDKNTNQQFMVNFTNEMQEVFKHGDLKVYRYASFLPRAFIVDGYSVIPDDEKLRDEILKASFDPLKVLLLSEPVKEMKPLIPESPSNSKASIISYKPNEIQLEVNMRKRGLLFLSEIYYPGWKAYVNNRSTKIYQANYTFRAIFLERGNHRIRLVFDPWPFKTGAAGSLITLLSSGIIFVLSYALGPRTKTS